MRSFVFKQKIIEGNRRTSKKRAASGSACLHHTRATYVPPHLHDRSPSSNFPAPPHAAPSLGNDRVGYRGLWVVVDGGGGSRLDHGVVVEEEVVVGIIKVVGGNARGSSM
ncbi:hypothetical protein OIU84_005450 [Salix udensis]|uniref:Uncharacterized protein n=1 Tax=Salix udensis TaxID=889485 RepID=A0AAD6JYD1_9ROSI|nr:hypothetical protein OIU84_005450 [Salix udensis]